MLVNTTTSEPDVSLRNREAGKDSEHIMFKKQKWYTYVMR